MMASTKKKQDFTLLYKSLGKKIRTLRKERGISQEGLAHKSGVDRSFTAQIERGIAKPSIATIAKIAQTLEVELYDLFKFET